MGQRVVKHGGMFTMRSPVRPCEALGGACAEGARSLTTFDGRRFTLRELCCTRSRHTVDAIGHHLLSVILNGSLCSYRWTTLCRQLRQGFKAMTWHDLPMIDPWCA